MRKALRLAKKAWGRTSPNPMVGAVVVRDGAEVGAGYHHKAGTPHAEPNALRAAGEQAQGATIYVTLEPCCTYGRTPPCTEAILKAGISRVVIGCVDPNPDHAGRGIEQLQAAGLEVTQGVLEAECLELNEAFFWWITHRRPFVLLKMAMTLDGKIATAGGQSQWITGPAARSRVQRMRQWCDAIMVGGETVRLDDPSLTVRSPKSWPCQPQPLIWTSRPLPSDCQVAQRGARTVKPETAEEWVTLLDELGQEGVTALLLEGGGELAASALSARIVNRVAFFVAPKILGGRSSRPVVGGAERASLDEAWQLAQTHCERVGEDFLLQGLCTDVYGIG
jgi:diaminohydroxyphosphoribosylaminopyrimidine deaminase/5-amino-6-(5-phosphoribosylamino)uracil reductase